MLKVILESYLLITTITSCLVTAVLLLKNWDSAIKSCTKLWLVNVAICLGFLFIFTDNSFSILCRWVRPDARTEYTIGIWKSSAYILLLITYVGAFIFIFNSSSCDKDDLWWMAITNESILTTYAMIPILMCQSRCKKREPSQMTRDIRRHVGPDRTGTQQRQKTDDNKLGILMP